MSLIHLTKGNYEKEVEKSTQPVVVDFWASWCMPCKMMAPVFEGLSKDYDGKAKFAKLNTDEEGDIANDNNITGIPCIIVFKGGEEAGRVVGYMDKEQLKKRLDPLIK